MIKTESEAWKYINRYGGRKQRERIDKSIEIQKLEVALHGKTQGQAGKQDKTGTQ